MDMTSLITAQQKLSRITAMVQAEDYRGALMVLHNATDHLLDVKDELQLAVNRTKLHRVPETPAGITGARG